MTMKGQPVLYLHSRTVFVVKRCIVLFETTIDVAGLVSVNEYKWNLMRKE